MNNKDIFCVCAFDLEKVHKACKRLTKQETDIIDTLFGFKKLKNNDQSSRTPVELARMYKCSVGEIFKIKDDVLEHLRHEFKSTQLHRNAFNCDMCLNGKWLSRSSKGEGYLMSVLLDSLSEQDEIR